jgi:tetratricopeptide (TPR) repeat protein
MKTKNMKTAKSRAAVCSIALLLVPFLFLPALVAQPGEAGVSTNSRLLEVGRLYWGDEKEAAILLAKQAVAQDPQNPDAVFFYGIVRLIGNPGFDAESFAEEYVNRLRTKADLARFIGMLYLWIREDEEAAEFFGKAIWLDATDAAAHTFLGLAHYRMARIKQGALQYDSPERLQQARRSLETAIRHEPNNAMACFYLGNVFCKLGDSEAAKRAFEQALAIEPANWHARVNLASVLLRLQQKEQARAQLAYHEHTTPARQELWAVYRQAFDADLEMFRF